MMMPINSQMITTPDGWTYTNLRPGIAINSDGRLKIWEGSEVLILPAPAAEIFHDIEFRQK